MRSLWGRVWGLALLVGQDLRYCRHKKWSNFPQVFFGQWRVQVVLFFALSCLWQWVGLLRVLQQGLG